MATLKEKPSGQIKRKDLLALPRRSWVKVSVYDWIYLVPSGKKHENGYSLVAIVGVSDEVPTGEIAAQCDDICWKFPMAHPYSRVGSTPHMLRTDAMFPSGVLRMWTSSEAYFVSRFRVGVALSSTEVEVVVEAAPGMGDKFRASMARVKWEM